MHRLFVWCDTRICPDSSQTIFARDDDVTFGVLHSRFHELWSLRLGTSPALAGVIYSRCRGWKKPPTAKELYDAFRSKAPTQRELALLGTWFREATVGELTEAHAQRAYTDRELVRAMHAIGFSRTEEPWAAHRIRLINSRAVR